MRGQEADRRYPHHDPAGDAAPGRRAELIALRTKHMRPVHAIAGTAIAVYLLTTFLASTAEGFMAAPIAGPLTVGLAFILLQCATTAGTIRWYARYAATKLDPITDLLRTGESTKEAVR
jgi:uncharacterized membrane protein (DUF485 family)